MIQPETISDVRRDYTPADVERLAGSFHIRHTLAEMGAARLRELLRTEPFLPTLGALRVITGGHSSTTALAASTEAAQFHQERPAEAPQYGHDEGLVYNHNRAVHDWAAQ